MVLNTLKSMFVRLFNNHKICATSFLILISSICIYKFVKFSSNENENEIKNKIIESYPPIWANQFEKRNEEENYTVCETENCDRLSNMLKLTVNWTADPCEDFYQFACGNWPTENPADFDSYVDIQASKVDKHISSLLDENDGITEFEKKSQLYYQSCSNLKSQTPFQVGQTFFNFLESKIGPTWKVWPKTLFNKEEKIQNFGEFYSQFHRELGNVEIFEVERTGLDTYTVYPNFIIFQEILEKHSITPDKEELKGKIRKDIEKDLNLMLDYSNEGEKNQTTESEKMIDKIMNFEMEMIEKMFAFEREKFNSYQNSKKRMADGQFMKIEEIQKLYKFIDWKGYFSTKFSKIGKEIPQNLLIEVIGTEYFQSFSDLVQSHDSSDEGRQMLKNYIVLKTLLANLFIVNSDGNTYCLNSTRVYNITEGKTKYIQRFCSRICLLMTQQHFKPAVSSLFVRNFLSNSNSSETLNFVTNMFENIRNAFIREISSGQYEHWLYGELETQVLERARNILSIIGHSEYIFEKKHFKLDISVDNFILNNMRLGEENDLKVFGGNFTEIEAESNRFDRAYWFTARFSHVLNTLEIPTGSFSSDLFKLDFPPAFIYGDFGRTIGHEFFHGFDFNSFFSRIEWTEEGPFKHNMKNLKCFINQCSGEERWLNEILPDHSGTIMAYHAFKALEKRSKKSQILDLKLTPDQLFFISSAQFFCERKPDIGRSYIHPPARSRVNFPLTHFPKFKEAFKCPKGSAYSPPKRQICKIW